MHFAFWLDQLHAEVYVISCEIVHDFFDGKACNDVPMIGAHRIA